MRRFLERFFPTPRTPITWRSAMPLVLFLAIFGGTCFLLDFTDQLMFVQPWAFLLLLVTPWIWWMYAAGYSGLSRGRSTTSLLVRLTVVGLFVVLLAEPRGVRTRDVVSVVYVVDVSDSVDQSRDQILDFISQTAAQKEQEEDEAGIVVFGRNAAVEYPPRQSLLFEKTYNSRVPRDATNIEQALTLATAMLKEENRGRIVLVSDGAETDGHMREVLDDLKSRGVAVDVLPVKHPPSVGEVLLERLDLPKHIKIGENYEADIVLTSRKAGSGRLVLKENGRTIFDGPVEFPAGKHRVTLPIKLREPGYYEYTASIRPDEAGYAEANPDSGRLDYVKANNSVRNFIFIEGEGKILLVHDPSDELDRSALIKALKGGKRYVEEMPSVDFPRTSLSLMQYDAIVFNNVPADQFDNVQMSAVHDAVYHLGIGFMMVGGPNSFGPGGYHHTPVEDALPVSMDITKKKVLPKGALVIILHTCEFPEGNTWAKRITKRAIKVLSDQDEVGCMGYGFNGGDDWIFELTPAGEYDKLVPLINAAEIGDMPNFTPTMRMGLAALKKSDAAAKHMIIISDGDPPLPPTQLLQDFKKSQVSVSTVAVFPHGGRDISTMQAIAGVTGGRFYFPDDPNQLPAIFIKEAKTLKRSMIQNKTITPELAYPDQVVEGIDSMQPLHGYVLTSPKPQATVVLKAPEEEEGEVDPIFSVWRYGLGLSAAFTSDFSENWGRDWAGWDKLEAFLQQTMIRVSRVQEPGNLRMWTYLNGAEGVIVVEDFHPDPAFLDISAVVSKLDSGRKRTASGVQSMSTDAELTESEVASRKDTFKKAEPIGLANGGNVNLKFEQVGPRRYQASVPLGGQGRYQVMAVARSGDRKESVSGGMIVPYSPEYLRFESNHVAMQEIAKVTGGEELQGDTNNNFKADAETIFGRRDPKRSSWPVFDWFILSLAVLLPIDVGIRRVQLDWSVIKGWFGLGRKSGSTTATMGTLLARKHEVGSSLEKGRKERVEQPLPTDFQRPPLPTAGKTTQSPGSQTTASAPAAKSEPATPPPRRTSTTSRLLDLKRKRDEEASDE